MTCAPSVFVRVVMGAPHPRLPGVRLPLGERIALKVADALVAVRAGHVVVDAEIGELSAPGVADVPALLAQMAEARRAYLDEVTPPPGPYAKKLAAIAAGADPESPFESAAAIADAPAPDAVAAPAPTPAREE